MNLLKDYFARDEDIVFSERLAKYRTTFTEEELNTDILEMMLLRLDKPSILRRFEDIVDADRKEFKEFILSKNKFSKPAKCKAFKKIVNIKKLCEKFMDDPEYYHQICLETNKLLKNIDTIINNMNTDPLRFYGIAKDKESLETSPFKILPNEIIIKVFDFVDNIDVIGEN
ncbi:MAG TPA: hypothetical protein LFW21_07615 [Rickettsia endosymbiont of Pyrocoelia pectoralis]|nr:hypothetical protein [Rickettsia endosymbiont of Pyrocoelia pectoralis]